MNKQEIEKAIEELKYQEDMRNKGINYQVDNLVIAVAISALQQQLTGGWIPIDIYEDITVERKRQDEKWGISQNSPYEWMSIIGEEYGELCKATNERYFKNGKGTDEAIKKEAIHVAACCIALLQQMERDISTNHTPSNSNVN